MLFVAWLPPEPAVLELRGLSRRIESLSKTVTQEKNRTCSLFISPQRIRLYTFKIEIAPDDHRADSGA